MSQNILTNKLNYINSKFHFSHETLSKIQSIFTTFGRGSKISKAHFYLFLNESWEDNIKDKFDNLIHDLIRQNILKISDFKNPEDINNDVQFYEIIVNPNEEIVKEVDKASKIIKTSVENKLVRMFEVCSVVENNDGYFISTDLENGDSISVTIEYNKMD